MQKTNSDNYRNSSHPVLSQTKNNTTLWIGHLSTDPNDHFAGQTFTCPADGLVNNIQVYSSTVNRPGDVALTLHEFDPISRSWGPAIGDATLFLQKGDDARWVRFYLQPVSLKKEVTYGFRLQTSNALVGIGEAANPSQQPFTFGHEWNGNSTNEKGYYLSYFSLAFKVELCA
ncbi:MAG: hypothetical protein H7Y01_13475 [Ferruginibacter sp.]|nr:hypothetical protein [Chitinophagaceae bacterium]